MVAYGCSSSRRNRLTAKPFRRLRRRAWIGLRGAVSRADPYLDCIPTPGLEAGPDPGFSLDADQVRSGPRAQEIPG